MIDHFDSALQQNELLRPTDSFNDKCYRELKLLGAGVNGSKTAFVDAAKNAPGQTALFFAESIVVGALMSRACPSFSWIRDLGKLLGVAGAYSLANNYRSNLPLVASALKDNWASPKNWDANYQIVSQSLGPILFETSVGLAGGVVGNQLGYRYLGEPLPRIANRLQRDHRDTGRLTKNCLAAGPEGFLADLKSNAAAFERFKNCTYLGSGRDSVALNIPGRKVLKLSYKEFPAEQRVFDVPVFERGKLTDNIYYRIEPRVKMTVLIQDTFPFKDKAAALGYPKLDVHKGNIGYYEGRLVLIDPFNYKD